MPLGGGRSRVSVRDLDIGRVRTRPWQELPGIHLEGQQMINSTQKHFTRIAGSAALGAMTTMGAAFAQSGAYLPSDDLVVVAMESLADAAGWSGSSTVEGFAGKGYVAWTGPDMSKKPGEGLVGFETSIQNGGSYELRLRNRHDHPDVTDANDVWGWSCKYFWNNDLLFSRFRND